MAQRYDEQKQTLWITSDLGGDDLVPNDEIQEWITALQEGRLEDGRAVRHINYIFSDREAAEYNHHALKFARLGTYVGDFAGPEPLDEDDGVSFDTKADFGMEE